MENYSSMSQKDYHQLLRDGWKPEEDYVFVSYSSRDWDKVYPCVAALRARGVNVYIDIEFMENQSSSWLQNFQDRLFQDIGCKGAAAFLSVNYMRSYACLMEQMANRTNKMRKRRGRPLPMFYVALEPEMNTVQSIASHIYSDAVSRQSARERVEMSPAEYLTLQKFILDSRIPAYQTVEAVQDLLDGMRDKHDAATTMNDLIFAGAQDMPGILAFEGPEQCAQLLADNFSNDKNSSIKIHLSEGLKRETADRLKSLTAEKEGEQSPENQAPAESPERGPAQSQENQGPAESLQERAERGEPDAQYELGRRYDEGDGMARDGEKAVYWYRKAAEQNHMEAQNNLGVCYEDGVGVRQDFQEAARWYRKSADQGNLYAQYNLAQLYLGGKGVEKSMRQAAEWLSLAAVQGDADSQYALGLLYLRGRGVEKAPDQAAILFRQAADQGCAEAQNSLGACYARGNGVEKDWAQAAHWYARAAEQGFAKAQHNLARRYLRGEGLEQDPVKAVYWLEKSAEQGYAYAQNDLADCWAGGTGVAQDLAAAARWRQKAAEQNLAEAQYRLGMDYLGGQGVEQSQEQARFWLQKAAAQGHAQAARQLENCGGPTE